MKHTITLHQLFIIEPVATVRVGEANNSMVLLKTFQTEEAAQRYKAFEDTLNAQRQMREGVENLRPFCRLESLSMELESDSAVKLVAPPSNPLLNKELHPKELIEATVVSDLGYAYKYAMAPIKNLQVGEEIYSESPEKNTIVGRFILGKLTNHEEGSFVARNFSVKVKGFDD